MTLLILDLTVPNLPSSVPDSILNAQLGAIIPLSALALINPKISLVTYLVLPIFSIVPGALDRYWGPQRAKSQQPPSD